jgi:hypothetical protein
VLNVPRYLARIGVKHGDAEPYRGGKRYRLEKCPFDDSHESPDAAVFQGTDGKTGFKCFHAHCADYHWQEFKSQVGEPAGDDYDPPRPPPSRAEPKAQPKAQHRPQPVLIPVSSLTPQRVEWLWHGRIPRGAVSLIDGDPDLGKSTILLDIAARVTRGYAMPPDAGGTGVTTPANVILLSAEDDYRRTIRPRLDAAGADVDRVTILDAVRRGADTAPPVLPFDLDAIEAAIVAQQAALLGVDPFSAYLDESVWMSR